jgi:hypothetical protein
MSVATHICGKESFHEGFPFSCNELSFTAQKKKQKFQEKNGYFTKLPTIKKHNCKGLHSTHYIVVREPEVCVYFWNNSNKK